MTEANVHIFTFKETLVTETNEKGGKINNDERLPYYTQAYTKFN